MKRSKNSMNKIVSKNIRLEEISLYKNNGLEYKKIELNEKNFNLLDVYFKTLTYDYLTLNMATKKSLLVKLCDVLLVN